MLESPDVLKSAYDMSVNESQGSAQEELDKYLDSIEGKIAQFKNEVQEFWYNLISSETVKNFIDFGTKAIDIIGKITDKIGLLGTAVISITGITSLNSILRGNASGGRVKSNITYLKSALINMPPNRLAERCARYWCV